MCFSSYLSICHMSLPKALIHSQVLSYDSQIELTVATRADRLWYHWWISSYVWYIICTNEILTKIAHASFISDTTHCPMVRSKSVYRRSVREWIGALMGKYVRRYTNRSMLYQFIQRTTCRMVKRVQSTKSTRRDPTDGDTHGHVDRKKPVSLAWFESHERLKLC